MTRILTYVDIGGHTRSVGHAYLNLRRGLLSGTFSYDRDYLGLPGAYAIDPVLNLTTGNWPLPRGLPSAFRDASPDRWGRNLIAKRLRAATAGGPTPSIDDLDYLLGVSDETRQGALRFKIDADGPYEHPSSDVPKLVSLPTLLHAAREVSRDGPDAMNAIKTLLDAGTGSLGGARPKASVRDGDQLMIAKFPHHSDEWNVMAWEKVALDLAEQAGIAVPRTRLVDIDGHAVLLLDRFDRNAQGRVGYVSAMTLVNATDGENRDYLELAEMIPDVSSRATADLQQLWRRIAFSIALHNTDDHLRNHGFLRTSTGWNLSPAFDMNPNPDLFAHRATSIAGSTETTLELQSLITAADYFGLTRTDAQRVLREVADAAAGWAAVARHRGLSAKEIARFAPTLDHTVAVVAEAGVGGMA